MIALVVAELGTRIPLAGYAYQWSARLVNSTYGWFVGFAGLLYMAVGGGAIMLGVAAPLLLSEFNDTTPSPHLVYFLITLGYAIRRRALDSIPGVFSLGRWAWPVIGFVLAYSALIMFVLSVPAPFHAADKVIGYGFGLALLWYVAALLWRLRRGTAGVKPITDLIDPQ